MNIQPEQIPEELKEREQWICWNEQTRNGKTTKIPKQPDGSGANAKANDMQTWGTFDDALETAHIQGWGIGYVFSDAGPYAGIDLDNSFKDNTTRPADWLPDLTQFVDETYIERSPSGTGKHIIIRDATVPDWWTNQERDTQQGHEGVEFYDSGRFFTFTGDKLPQISADTINEIDQLRDWLLTVYEHFNGSLPTVDTHTDYGGDADIDLSVYDILPAARYPSEERHAHPYHGSDTGANFMIDDGGDTWRCWRHDCTGNALHLLGIEQGIIDCGDWTNRTIPSETWRDIFDAARDDGYDIPDPTPDDPEPIEELDDDDWTIDERIERLVTDPLDPPEDSDRSPISHDEAIERTAHIYNTEYDFVRPREDTRGWRDTLYVYQQDVGVYEPHGTTYIARKAEAHWGSFATNQRVKELTGKLERLNQVSKRRLEAHPERLVVNNGILDLTTGELDDHTPEEYHRTRLDVDYQPDATCPRIDDFLHDIVDPGDVPTLYRLIAHTLYKQYEAQKAAMLLGEGQNGKSVFLSLVEEFIGEYNVSNQSLQSLNEDEWAANNLVGKLANVHPDMSDQNVQTMDTFKALTGGDNISANVKYERPIKFENHASLIFACNRMPVLKDDTMGNWRRWILIDFPNTFERGDGDWQPKHELMTELTQQDELEGLLARCVEEIQRWDAGDAWFPTAPDWEETRRRIRRAAEPVYDFAHACLRDQDDGFVESETMRTVYRRYAEEEGLPNMTPETFGQKLLNVADLTIEKGQKRVDGKRKTCYKNVMLSPRGRQLAEGEVESEGDQSHFGGPRGRATRLVEITRAATNGDGTGVHREYVLGQMVGEGMERELAESALQKARNQGDIQGDEVIMAT